jgi:hypothetical protein
MSMVVFTEQCSHIYGRHSSRYPSSYSATNQAQDGLVHFEPRGESGHACLIESSDDLINWTPGSTVQNVGGTADISQQIPQGAAQRFYRAVRPP